MKEATDIPASPEPGETPAVMVEDEDGRKKLNASKQTSKLYLPHFIMSDCMTEVINLNF